ncbi:MAG: hypothetical protein EP329_14195, partial [Deltaproteobacteria bacterium]
MSYARLLVPSLVLTFGAACGDAERTPTDTAADADSANDADTSEGSTGTVLAEGVLGWAGGELAGGGVVLAVPVSALGAPTHLKIIAEAETPDGVTAFAPVLRFEPAGVTFALPAALSVTLDTARWSGEEVAAFWSLPGDTTRLQRVPAAVSDGVASLHAYHFSFLMLVGPGVPYANQWGCCEQIDPAVTPLAHCVLNPANNVVCDPDLCIFTPGPCPQPPAPPLPPTPPTCAQCDAAVATGPAVFTNAWA